MKKGTLARTPDDSLAVILCRPNAAKEPEWIAHDGLSLLRVREDGAKALGYLVRLRQREGWALYGLRGESEEMGGKMFWTPMKGDRMLERREIVRELNRGGRADERRGRTRRSALDANMRRGHRRGALRDLEGSADWRCEIRGGRQGAGRTGRGAGRGNRGEDRGEGGGMLEAVDMMLWWLFYTVAGGTCLVIGSVFLSFALMIARLGWEAGSARSGGGKEGEYSLRRDEL